MDEAEGLAHYTSITLTAGHRWSSHLSASLANKEGARIFACCKKLRTPYLGFQDRWSLLMHLGLSNQGPES